MDNNTENKFEKAVKNCLLLVEKELAEVSEKLEFKKQFNLNESSRSYHLLTKKSWLLLKTQGDLVKLVSLF